MRNIKKLGAIATTLTMSLSLLSGCSSTKEQTTTGFQPELDTETTASLSVIGDYSNFEALEAIIDDFNEYYPNVTITYTKCDFYNVENLQTMLDSSEKPDICMTSYWMRDTTLMDSFEDMSFLDLSNIQDGLITKSNDEVKMVPIFTNTYGMIVNEQIFEENNLTVPTTYSELIDVCAKLKEAGYESPIMGYTGTGSAEYLNSISYPMLNKAISENPEAIDELNPTKISYDEEGSTIYEYKENADASILDSTLEKVQDFTNQGLIDVDKCSEEISDGYEGAILRFFEGDVPMLFTNAETLSGTKKRETLSEAYQNNSFEYNFYLTPLTDDGCYFELSLSRAFSVNAKSENLDMTNEFMRFLVQKDELNKMAQVKGLPTVTNDYGYDERYATFNDYDPIYSDSLNITDGALRQVREAVRAVASKELTIQQAEEKYGKY